MQFDQADMTGPLTAAGASIRAFSAAEAEARLGELSALLVDAVAHGASVNFMAGVSDAEGRAFWRGQFPGIAAGARRLLVAENDGLLVGTVVLTFAPQPNAPHWLRADRRTQSALTFVASIFIRRVTPVGRMML